MIGFGECEYFRCVRTIQKPDHDFSLEIIAQIPIL